MSVEVIVGTYEELLLGYRLTHHPNDEPLTLEQSFTNHSHSGCVRCVSACDRYLASGSSDETIRLFNMTTRAEIGTIVQHEGNITCLRFLNNTHLFSGSDDSTVCIWRSGNWQCIKTLSGHKSGVTSIAIHPGGKLAMSVSKDKSLRTWNLIKGRNAYITNLKAIPDLIEWSPNGQLYAVAIDKRLDIYDVEKASIVHTIDFGKRINAVAFLSDAAVAIGGESPNIEIHSVKKNCVYCHFQAHTNRIKGVATLAVVDDPDHIWLFSCSSDGSIKLWQLPVALKKAGLEPTLLASVDTGCRITCLAVHRPSVLVKREKEENEEVKSETESVEGGSDIESGNVEEENGEEVQDTTPQPAKKRKAGKQKLKRKKKKVVRDDAAE